jgi:hypothetical protein
MKEATAKSAGAAEIKAVEEPHEKIHLLAKQAVAAYNPGDSRKADQLYKEREAVSKQILDYLERVRVDCSEESAETFIEGRYPLFRASLRTAGMLPGD